MTALEKVQARGEQKGIEKGKREGIREGIQEGKREGILETAKNMLQFGISRENIAKMTGLATGDLRLL